MNSNCACSRPLRSSTGTHLPALVRACFETVGPIVELGVGIFSTPILHALCAGRRRPLVSLEADRPWFERFCPKYAAEWHRFYLVPDWDRLPELPPQIAVAFIDQAPGQARIKTLGALRGRVDVFVIHDTDSPLPGRREGFECFRYVRDCAAMRPWTTLLSDALDVRAWDGI